MSITEITQSQDHTITPTMRTPFQRRSITEIISPTRMISTSMLPSRSTLSSKNKRKRHKNLLSQNQKRQRYQSLSQWFRKSKPPSLRHLFPCTTRSQLLEILMSTTGIVPTLIHSLPSLHHLSRVVAVPHIQATTPARYQAQDTQVHHHTHLTHIAPAMQPMDQTHHL